MNKNELSAGTTDEQRTDADNSTSASLAQNGLLPAVGVVKVRTEKEQDKWSKTTKFYVNDVFVCECEVGGDYYCTVSRSGNPSNIRNKWKKTYKTRWQHWEIKNLLGEKYNKDDFKDEYPDLRFGYQGSVVSAKKVNDIFGKYLNSDTVNPIAGNEQVLPMAGQ